MVGENLEVGDRVYLYIPAIQKGTTRKLASLWRGPYTVIDRLGPVNYRIQLIGNRSKVSVVHRNRLKLCYEDPVGVTPDVDTQTDELTDLPRYVHGNNSDEVTAGFTTIVESNISTGNDQQPITPQIHPNGRSARNRRPPNRYGQFVTN